MPRRSTKRTPFSSLSRRNKKLKYNRVRNRILRAAPVLGGKFITHAYMHGENGWIDADFLGKKPFVIYGLTLLTTRCEYSDLVSDRVWDMSFEVVPDVEFDALNIKQACGYITNMGRQIPPELGNMTRGAWARKKEQTVADSGEIQVFERCTLHHNYHSCIGLRATLDVPFLTIEAVNAFIDRFLLKESAFSGTVPHTYRHDQIPHWGIDANAVVEPWDWAAAVAAQHVTPADGNVFLNLGFEPVEAAKLQADSQTIVAVKLAKQAVLAAHGDGANVYADLGYDDADGMQRKSALAAQIARAIEAQHLTSVAACELLGIDQAQMLKITHGQFRYVRETELTELAVKLEASHCDAGLVDTSPR